MPLAPMGPKAMSLHKREEWMEAMSTVVADLAPESQSPRGHGTTFHRAATLASSLTVNASFTVSFWCIQEATQAVSTSTS